MAWICLISAGLLEVGWSYAMKLSNGFTRFWPTAIMMIMMVVSFGLLTYSVRTLPLGTAYAIWTGIGAVGAFLLGVLLLGEEASIARIIAAALIVSGIVVMKVASSD